MIPLSQHELADLSASTNDHELLAKVLTACKMGDWEAKHKLERMFQPLQQRSAPAGKYEFEAQNLGQHEYFRKFNADFSIEMSRSVREMLKNWD